MLLLKYSSTQLKGGVKKGNTHTYSILTHVPHRRWERSKRFLVKITRKVSQVVINGKLTQPLIKRDTCNYDQSIWS